MKAQINPGWLVSLMCRWVIRRQREAAGALGYPKKAIGFSEKTTGGYSHSTPCAFTIDDFADLEVALEELKASNQDQFVTMMMYYKPWTVDEARACGMAFGNSTYYKRLHAAHSFVATKLDDKRQSVEYIHLNVA